MHGLSEGYVYKAAVDYALRVIPHCDGVAIPLEANRILWQRCLTLKGEPEWKLSAAKLA